MAADWDLSVVCKAFSEAAEGGCDWRLALDVVSDHLGAAGATIVPLRGEFKAIPTSRSFEEAIDAYFREGWSTRDLRFKGVAIMQKRRVATDLDFISPETIRNDPYYQEWLRPFGLKWFAGVHVGSGQEEWALSIQRSEAQGPLTDEEVGKLRLLSCGMSSAVAVGSALGFARAEAALEAFDISNRAVVVLNKSGEAVLLNRAAERLICDDLQICNRHLTCRDEVAGRRLDTAIRAVCRLDDGSNILHPVRITRSNGAPIFAFVTPARGVALDVFSHCRAFVILVDPMDRKIPSPEMLQKLFPLTPTEARLAHRLATGHKLHELSVKSGFSYETGRNHLKNIFAKLGVNSQSDLIAALISIAAPISIL